MSTIALSNMIVENHFRFLKNLDIASKKRLIVKLIETIDKPQNTDKLDKLFGAWKDSRDADEIVDDIRKSRVNSRELEEF